MRFVREIKVKKQVDVCIVGGGPAGCAAALAAARQGVSVYLAEANTCLGGLGTVGGVPLFMTFSDGVNFVADGIGREILERMNTEDTDSPLVNSIHPEILKRTYENMLSEAGVDFTFMTEFIGRKSMKTGWSAPFFTLKADFSRLKLAFLSIVPATAICVPKAALNLCSETKMER